MLARLKRKDEDARRPRWIIFFAVLLPLFLAASLFTVFAATVQANTSLARPASMTPPSIPVEVSVPNVAQQGRAKSSRNPWRGLASWYGSRFDGRKTASGERYNLHEMTACDNTLPFGSMVRVVNLKNHRSVVVRINDRGSLLPGRVIDLSYAAAHRLHMLQDGLAPVELEVLSLGYPPSGN